MRNSFRKGGNQFGGSGVSRGNRGGRNRGGAWGPGGFCICVKCGEKVRHQQGLKCSELKCSRCGHTMVREEMLGR